jgi:hypothetical protein
MTPSAQSREVASTQRIIRQSHPFESGSKQATEPCRWFRLGPDQRPAGCGQPWGKVLLRRLTDDHDGRVTVRELVFYRLRKHP